MAFENLSLVLNHQTARDLYVLLKKNESHINKNLTDILNQIQKRIYEEYNIEELEELNMQISTL